MHEYTKEIFVHSLREHEKNLNFRIKKKLRTKQKNR